MGVCGSTPALRPTADHRRQQRPAAAERLEQTYHRARKYYHGIGVERTTKNARKAARWFRIGAEQGHAPSQVALGVCYYHGRGCPVDAALAMHWFQAAAVQNYAEAQYRLAVCYDLGLARTTFYTEHVRTADEDLQWAANWLRAAARFGHGKAIRDLENYFSRGLLLEPSVWTLARQMKCNNVDEELRRRVHTGLLRRARDVTFVLRCHRTSPLYQWCMSRETFVEHIVRRVCTLFERGVAIVPSTDDLHAVSGKVDRNVAAFCHTTM